MIIELSPDQPPRLVEAERLDRLHAVGSADATEASYDDLCQPGPDADHVWIDIAGLRAAALAQVADPSYPDRFEAMVAYSTEKGWLDELGTRVRAHVER